MEKRKLKARKRRVRPVSGKGELKTINPSTPETDGEGAWGSVRFKASLDYIVRAYFK